MRIRSAAPFFLLAFLVASAPAVAQKKKDEDKPKPSAKLKSTEEDKARQRRLRYRQEDIDLDIKIERKRDETIRLLIKLLKDFPKEHPKRADMLRRLAELYWEKAKFMYFQKMRKHDKDMAKWVEGGSKGPEPKLNLMTVQVYNKKAINICEAILKQYPDYTKLDEVLFFLGYNYGEIGKKAKALSFYKRLTKQFPQSQHVAEAWLQVGEHYFDANNVYEALQAFQKAVTFTGAKTFGYAMYKLAWCYYNLGEYGKAIDLFKQVVSYSVSQEKKGKSKIQLREEALKDLVRTYADDENVEDAEAYFKSVGGGKYLRMMYNLLAQTYYEQGKDNQSIDIFTRLINLDKLHVSNPDSHLMIVKAYQRLGDKKKVVKEIVRLLDIYEPAGEWAKANEEYKETLEETRDTLEANLRLIVVTYHKQYIKRKSKSTAKAARKLYEMYLSYFPDRPYSRDLRFFYAELLYFMAKQKKTDMALWNLSYDQYMAVVEMLKGSKKKKDRQRLELSAYNSIIVMEHQLTAAEKASMLKQDSSGKVQQRIKGGTKPDEDLDKKAKEVAIAKKQIPEKLMRLIKACESYIKLVPESKYKIDIRYKAAKIYYDHNHFDNAAGTFYGIVKNHPKHKLAELAANLILDSLNMAKNWPELNKRAREFRGNKKLVKNRKFAGLLSTLVMQSQYMMAYSLQKQEKYDEAAQAFITFVKDWPKSNYCGKALYSASAFLANAAKIEESIKLRQRLNKEYPKFEYITDNTFEIAELQQRLIYWDKAAKTYEALVAKLSKAKNGIPRANPKADDPKASDELKRKKKIRKMAGDAVFNAGVLWQNLGRRERAIERFREYIDKFPEREDASGLLLSIGDLQMKENKEKEAFEAYEDWLKRFGKGKDPKVKDKALAVRFKMAKVRWNKGGKDKEQAVEWFKKIVERATDERTAAADKTPALLTAAAEASFMMAEAPFQEYAAIKLKLPVKKLEAGLKEKAKGLLETVKLYETIVSYKQAEWAIAALYMIGQANQNFARTMYDAPIPRELTPEQADIYQQGLANKAIPIEERAVEAYKKAMDKSFELNMYTEWTKKAMERLSEMKPNTYAAAKEIRPATAASFMGFHAPKRPAPLSDEAKKRAEEQEAMQRRAPPPPAEGTGEPATEGGGQ